MKRVALAAAAALAAVGGPGAGAAMAPAGPHVEVGFASYAPVRIDVIRGDTVTWSNVSVRAHTVTADDGSFDSGRLGPTDSYTRTLDAVGTIPYHCTLHPFIRAEVDVSDILLSAPGAPAGPGRAYPLAGRSDLPDGTTLRIEADSGSGFAAAGSAKVGPDGSFATSVKPTTTASYRAVAGDAQSPPVQLVVLDHRVSISRSRTGRRFTVDAQVTPAAAGSPVVLQLRLPEHFGWWPVARGKLDASSRARLTVSLRRTVPARVLLTLPDGATALATSPTLRLGPRS